MDDYPLLNLFWTMLWFFLWIMWLFLLFRVITDIFRSDDLGGWAKAGWLILALVLPYLGVLIYVIVRGRTMGKRDAKDAKERDAAFKAYVRDAAGTSDTHGATKSSHIEDLTKLADLKDKGAISDEEYQREDEAPRLNARALARGAGRAGVTPVETRRAEYRRPVCDKSGVLGDDVLAVIPQRSVPRRPVARSTTEAREGGRLAFGREQPAPPPQRILSSASIAGLRVVGSGGSAHRREHRPRRPRPP